MDLERMWYSCPFEFGVTYSMTLFTEWSNLNLNTECLCPAAWLDLSSISLYTPRTGLTPLDEGLNEDL